jgi:hypothetical protein
MGPRIRGGHLKPGPALQEQKKDIEETERGCKPTSVSLTGRAAAGGNMFHSRRVRAGRRWNCRLRRAQGMHDRHIPFSDSHNYERLI